MRRKTKVIRIGGVRIGGNHPLAIQSMTKTKTSDINRTNEEIRKLENAGCEIVRLAVKDSQDARAFKKIRRSSRLPLVADIHFNWRLAIEAIDNGADKIRLNPGNIYKKEEIKNIVSALKQAKIPLRVGVNSGSVRDLNSARSSLADRLVKGALDYVKIIEDMNFYNIVISLKASSVLDTIEAYRKISKICDYPMHLGLTATGFPFQGAIKSSIAIGVLLLEGIGDTIRVSLTDQPVHEIRAAQSILESLGLRHFGPQIISCPTCGRCQVDLVKLVGDFEKKLTTYHLPLTTKSFKVAIMGCEVNGPGEAREADIGIAFGKKTGVLFRKGEIEKKVSYANSLGYLLNELKKRR
ncbi:MAG: flavodoxin-dependent (E)-4-hydroxy-3-methylbut-2-enyl-diphosphate synthase [Candidatus Omnitrophica bacterium]|nr:flavodoxin-dependent (E)-4-hydroxy-3-methylbut-2-enyl-diphosphate synthase [Candidatus Omnitrophota bacterium]